MASAGQPITMNLQDSGEGMVPFGQGEPPPPQPSMSQSSRPVKEQPSAAFGPPPKNPTDSITDVKEMMDSTPIDDVLSPEEMQGPPPQMMPPQMPSNQGAMMMQPQVVPQQDAPKKPAAPQNPMNLTDEQMQALMVAFAAALAFSDPVQGKLGKMIPNFLVDGERGTIGLVVSGLVAALVFYLAQRFMSRA